MGTIVERIKEMGIPTSSMSSVVATLVRKWPKDRTTKSEYENLVELLTGHTVILGNHKEAELTFMYVVQESIMMTAANIPDDTDAIMEKVRMKVKKFIQENPWVLDTPVPEVNSEVSSSNTQPSKTKSRGGVTKRQQAIDLYKANKDVQMSRQEWIRLFVKELGLTEGGASTYVHNCRSGIWS